MPAKKTRYTPYATTHIEGLFDIFSPKRLNPSIRLKGVKSYYHRDGWPTKHILIIKTLC